MASVRDIRALARRAASAIADLALDGAGVAGAGLVTYGIADIYRPAGFIAAGLFLLTGAWLMARKAAD